MLLDSLINLPQDVKESISTEGEYFISASWITSDKSYAVHPEVRGPKFRPFKEVIFYENSSGGSMSNIRDILRDSFCLWQFITVIVPTACLVLMRDWYIPSVFSSLTVMRSMFIFLQSTILGGFAETNKINTLEI